MATGELRANANGVTEFELRVPAIVGHHTGKLMPQNTRVADTGRFLAAEDSDVSAANSDGFYLDQQVAWVQQILSNSHVIHVTDFFQNTRFNEVPLVKRRYCLALHNLIFSLNRVNTFMF